MKLSPRAQAAHMAADIAAMPPGSTIYVPAIYAPLFRRIPNDGHTYIVEDPQDRRVTHWTHSDGRYERIDSSKLTIKVGPVRVKGAKRKRAQARLAGRGDLTHVRTTRPQAPPELCLIDLPRVMLICGFRKSFIYEREDFPKPIRLGTEQRSAVRWVETEVLEWVRTQIALRPGPSV